MRNPLSVPGRLILALLVAVVSCQTTTTPDPPVATTITISPSTVAMSFLGQNSSLGAQVRDQNGDLVNGLTLSWSSSDTGVATVTPGGVVTAVANGSATISVTAEGITGTAEVAVEQVPTTVAIISGDDQEATAGETLDDPIVARAQDAGGAGVEGVTITFTPDADNGSVSVESGDSDANGELSTVWTLGAPYGQQRLVAAITGADAEVGAIGRSEFPIADLAIAGDMTVDRSDPSTLESFSVSATVENEGDLTTVTPFTVRLLSNAAEVATTTVGPLTPGETEEVTFAGIGPLTAGAKSLRIEVDSDDEITELIETNNDVSQNVTVVTQSTITVGGSAPINVATNAEELFLVTVPPGSEAVLDIELTGASGDGDIYVHRGDRPSDREAYQDCAGLSSDSNELCQMVFPEGDYHIVVHGFAAMSGTLSVSYGTAVEPFDIDVVILDSGSPAQDAAFQAAADRWSEIIIRDVPDFDWSGNPFPANQCATGQPAVSDVVDDIRIYVRITDIDGPGGTLGQAGPCTSRIAGDPDDPIPASVFPILGQMQFDAADLDQLEANGALDAVVLHEMAHVLGFGTMWGLKGLLQNPSLPSNQGADTHFSGDDAISAFDLAGGSGFPDSKVPVENEAGQGSGDSHWREVNFGTELMTPFLTSGTPNPLSAVTIASFADLGYGVDMSQSDAYGGVTLAPPGPALVTLDGLIDLGDHVSDAPNYVYDMKGNLVRVVR